MRKRSGVKMAVDVQRVVSFFLHGEAARTVDWKPATDIYRTSNGWLVKMELAGVKREDVNISLRGRTLLVRGRRRDCALEEGAQQLHMEIAYDLFERSVELPAELHRVTIETSLQDGMLLIRITPEG